MQGLILSPQFLEFFLVVGKFPTLLFIESNLGMQFFIMFFSRLQSVLELMNLFVEFHLGSLLECFEQSRIRSLGGLDGGKPGYVFATRHLI